MISSALNVHGSQVQTTMVTGRKQNVTHVIYHLGTKQKRQKPSSDGIELKQIAILMSSVLAEYTDFVISILDWTKHAMEVHVGECHSKEKNAIYIEKNK